jgi:hypothetical protein
MVKVGGGTVTIEDSTFSHSSISGVTLYGGTTVIRRSKFEANADHGLYSTNSAVSIEDSAFWSNGQNGIEYWANNSYTGPDGTVTGSSIWHNGETGVRDFPSSGATLATHGLQGHVAGEPGNVVYDNGTFGFSSSEEWQQLDIEGPVMDWSGTYWGPVAYEACSLGSQRGHLSYGAPSASTTFIKVPRGPVK